MIAFNDKGSRDRGNVVWVIEGCPFCERAVKLVTRITDDNTKLTIHTNESGGITVDNLLSFNPKARSYPQIYLGLTHIGGLAELESYLSIQDLGQHNGL